MTQETGLEALDFDALDPSDQARILAARRFIIGQARGDVEVNYFENNASARQRRLTNLTLKELLVVEGIVSADAPELLRLTGMDKETIERELQSRERLKG